MDLHENDSLSKVAVQFLSRHGYDFHDELVTNRFASPRDSYIFSKPK